MLLPMNSLPGNSQSYNGNHRSIFHIYQNVVAAYEMYKTNKQQEQEILFVQESPSLLWETTTILAV